VTSRAVSMPTVATMNQPFNLPPEQLFECFERFLPAERDPQSCWIWRGAKHGKRLRMAVYRWPPRSCATVLIRDRAQHQTVAGCPRAPLRRKPAVRQSRACHPIGRARPRSLVHADHQRRAGDSPAGVNRRPHGYCQASWSQPVGSWQYRQSPRELGPG